MWLRSHEMLRSRRKPDTRRQRITCRTQRLRQQLLLPRPDGPVHRRQPRVLRKAGSQLKPCTRPPVPVGNAVVACLVKKTSPSRRLQPWRWTSRSSLVAPPRQTSTWSLAWAAEVVCTAPVALRSTSPALSSLNVFALPVRRGRRGSVRWWRANDQTFFGSRALLLFLMLAPPPPLVERWRALPPRPPIYNSYTSSIAVAEVV